MEISKHSTFTGSGVRVSTKATQGSDTHSRSSGVQDHSSSSTPALPEGTRVMVSRIAQRMISESSVDEARVARLAARIQSGQYQIDDRRVATRMIELDKSIQQTMNHDG
ncbi:MAG: hypothetical protein RLZZ226_562 [Pseudomonadota bacterium]|jgi:flagellar biosynthesis anti-sigma factor FlgM